MKKRKFYLFKNRINFNTVAIKLKCEGNGIPGNTSPNENVQQQTNKTSSSYEYDLQFQPMIMNNLTIPI